MTETQTVLIIDDDPDIIAAEKLILESKGYNVLTATNGKTGLDVLNNNAVDIILLDVMMDTDDEGFQLSYQLKSNPKTAKIPIIMVTSVSKVTGIPYSPDTDDYYLPVEDFIEKPVQPKELIRRVEALLEKAKA